MNHQPYRIPLTHDFYLGAPLGAIIATGITLTPSARPHLALYLLIGAALALTVTIATQALTVALQRAITPAYAQTLARYPGGTFAAVRPFDRATNVSDAATIWLLFAASAMPVVQDSDWATVALVTPAGALLMWATLGCGQAIGHLGAHQQEARRANSADDLRRANAAVKNGRLNGGAPAR